MPKRVPFTQTRTPYTQRGVGVHRVWVPVRILTEHPTMGQLHVECAEGIRTWIVPAELKYRLEKL